MDPINLPTFEDVSELADSGAKLTPLQQFVYDHEPAGVADEAAFREQLTAVLAEERRGGQEARELLRSACAIAERKGEGTHWGRFIESIRKLGLNGITARTYRVLPSDKEDES